MILSEAQIFAGLSVLAQSLGLTSTDTIGIAVNSDADNFSCEIGENGIQSFEYSNSKVSILSKDKLYIIIIASFAAGVAVLLLVPNFAKLFKK